MSAIRPLRVALAGAVIRLEPMTREHLPALFRAIAHPEVFAGGYGGGPAGYRDTEAGFLEWAETGFEWERGNVYAVVAQRDGGAAIAGTAGVGGVRLAGGTGAGAVTRAGTVVGTTTMSDFDLPNESTHIGWTAYDPRVWGSAVNPDVKLLMLGTAFDHGFGRVRIQADAANARSRAAIAKLGATFEGLARRDKRRADGGFRDTAIFSVTIDDWPSVRAGLESRIAAHLAGAG